MIDLAALKGSRYAVLGLARSGLAAARALQAGGVDYMAWDDDAARRLEARERGLSVADPGTADWSTIEALVLSPGIPHTHPQPHPLAALARAHGRQIIGDIELLWRALPRARGEAGPRFVGITGTNGKSTTTALIGHILRRAGRAVEVGGNLGPPVLDFARLGADGIYVLEMSSYQLELADRLRFDVAVLLNITPDHLERHGGMAGYVAAKRRIFRGEGQVSVIGVDSEPSRALARELTGADGARRVVPVAVGHAVDGGVWVADGMLTDGMEGPARQVIDLRGIATLPGAHNWENAAAAYAACRALGLEVGDIAEGLRSYPGLAHRQERVRVIGGIAYVNDSKATNADAAGKALASYDAIYWILGGVPKEGGIDSLVPLLPRVTHAFLIGQASDAFAAVLEGKVPFSRCGDLAAAVAQAHALAQREARAGAVVLLSPACASFDQWPNFEARGDGFRALVRALPETVS